MNSTSRLAILGLALSLSTLLLFSCEDPQPEVAEMVPVPDNEANCRNLMEWHLKALAEKNLAMLESTLSPDGEMQLILPSDEIAYGTEYFMEGSQTPHGPILPRSSA